MTAEAEIKQMWLRSGAQVFDTPEEAEEAWQRLTRLLANRQRQQNAAVRIERAQRRAEREQRTYRGAPTVTQTCGVCGTQHPGEC